MSNEENDLKLKQFDEFFSIKHNFNINAKSLVNNEGISYDDFIKNMPASFKLANDIDILDQAALAPLGAISGIAGQLVKYLHHQSQKIDLLINHILTEQDDKEYRYQGITFGGGGISFTSDSAFPLHDMIEVKVFLTQENCAVYSHCEVISIEKETNKQKYLHKAVFHHIREDDRERLVRSSLHRQSKQLQQLAKERNKKTNE